MSTKPSEIYTEPVRKTGSFIRTHRETSESDVEIGRANLEAVELRESEVMSSSIAGVGLSLGDFTDTDMG